ncbi:helix-turn-helix transcriptional regulator [uncultured Veillonella sp.]|uniref:ArsR/SmtB family transcription factor n=1 Tax=uncultured Veillonella sp. TaxID=159268 RepID=UPI0025FE340F|nr:metalloregulator ArsR/SmtB family transcription factor [uncultured Veillonella sp.]MDY3973633.1 metalloregulator ArsR/SmtB family transcription factor [Veillonella caviae]
MENQQLLDIFKALSNESRLKILQWLKDPKAYFPPQSTHSAEEDVFKGGVCVGSIQDKLGISQSAVSHYLDMMQRAGLLESVRIGKWTYYRRNEATIKTLVEHLGESL